MTRLTPTIRETMLFANEEGQKLSIAIESAQWYEWLNRETSTTFSFQSENGSYTARKERVGNRRRGWYWKAYRKAQGTLYRAYLGKPEDLTLARLNEIAHTIAMRIQENNVIQQHSSKEVQSLHENHDTNIVPPLLETKLHPPQLPPSLVERTRLLTLLDSSLKHKLTLLMAPAGSGKTTLVNQWLVTRSTQSAFPSASWISLDAGDNDPFRFWRTVITAFQRLLGEEQRALGQAAMTLLTAAKPTRLEQSSMEFALTHLLNSLTTHSTGRLLILDDYHIINEPYIHETLAFFIDHLPQSTHVLLLSRVQPPLPLLRWQARGELCELHAIDLRFSTEETAEFLRQASPITLSEVVLKQLDTSLEGWAAGLRLLSLTLSRWRNTQAIEQALLSLLQPPQGGTSQEKRDGWYQQTPLLSRRSGGFSADESSPYRMLFDYFVTEILEMQPEPLQRFLLQTSVLGRLCGPLCDAVTESEQSTERLETIARAGLFLETLEGPGGWYRYHMLFAEAMRSEASRRLGEAELQACSLRASIWYEQEAQLTEAIEAAWLAQDMERMARLIEQINMQNFYEPQTLLHWLERLPATVLHEYPLLCHLFAIELRFPMELRFPQAGRVVPEIVSLSDAENRRIDTLLQMAEDGWRRRGEFHWPGANLAFRALAFMIDQNKPLSIAVSYSQEALSYLLGEKTLDTRLQMYRSSSLLFVGIGKLCQGEISEAQQFLLQAQEDNIPPGNQHLATELNLMLGQCHMIQGNLQRARQYQRQALSSAREWGYNEIAATSLLDLAWLAFETNDLASVEQQVREALEVIHHLGPHWQELHDRATWQLALLHYARGESTMALEQLSGLLPQLQKEWTLNDFWLFTHIHTWWGRLSIESGDLLAVQNALETKTHSSEMASFTEHLGEQILRGRLWLAQGDARVAREYFAHILPMAQEHLHHYTALEIQLLLALAHVDCKEEQQAHYWLRQTLVQAVHEGYVRLFLNEGKLITQLLRSLLPTLQHDPTLHSYVQMLLRASVQKTGVQSTLQSPSDSLLQTLSTQEKRVLRLMIVGRTNHEIAQELIVSVNTVKYHVKHLYQKLGVSNRLQASEVVRSISLDELN